jgi:formate dehydrogenase maturation protein FdhE
MAMNDKDREVLRALSEAIDQHEDLAELLEFYYDLYQVQFEAKTRVPRVDVRDPLAMRWRLEGGIPQLTSKQLGIEPVLFQELVSQISEVLLRHNPGWRLGYEGMDSETLLQAAQQAFETWDTLTAPEAGTGREWVATGTKSLSFSLAVSFALAPYLQRAAEVILPQLDVSLWLGQHCLICGGSPNFALLESTRGARQLMCSRCNAIWSYRRVGCPFCGTGEKQTYYPSPDGVYRLYVCPSCNRYLKTMDLREVSRPVYPVVERLLTVGMDLAARQQGFGG